MAEKLDPKQVVTFEELLRAMMFETEATSKSEAYDFVAGLNYTDFQVAKGEISDHLPTWAEFRVDGPDDD